MEQAKPARGKKILRHIGKRNLIILSVMLLIGLAVYLNYLWFYHPTDNTVNPGNTPAGSDGSTAAAEEPDYFAATSLARETSRRESMEVLQKVVDSGEGEEREAALTQISAIAAAMEKEANIETLIKADGYAQCVAVINGDSASVVVSSEVALDAARVATITGIVYEQAGILPANLTVKQK